MPQFEEWELKKYWEIFSGLNPEDGKLSGERVLPVLANSRLPAAQLALIWLLADIDRDSKLDFEEFCITMRLVFDLVNGTMTEVPAALPAWLVPASKAHFIDLSLPNYDEELQLLNAFDWYILPADKARYDALIEHHLDNLGRVLYDLLAPVYLELDKVPPTDVSLAWNLVNPKQALTIDRNQAEVFLHIIHQRQLMRRIPRTVPASLRATFGQEKIDYSVQNQNTVPAKQRPGQLYAQRLELQTTVGTDFSATKDTDWEEVLLKRQLADLERRIDELEAPSAAQDSAGTTKYEFEQMAKFYETLAARHRAPLLGVRSDIADIEQQLEVLEGYLQDKQRELASMA